MIRKLLSFATLMLILSSCANDIDNSSRLQMRTGADSKLPVFYATIEGSDDAATKVFADEQLRVLWNADDRITVFNKHSYGYEYSFTGEDGDNAGEFAAVPNNNIVTGNPLDHVYALYPHNSFTKISNDGVITATLPANQTYKANSFGIGANTMVSITDDTQLRFKNVGGYLSFKLYGDHVSVKSITLKGNNGEKLAGKASITMAVGGTPTIEMQEDAAESITLTCKTPEMVGTISENPTEFWFVIPPTTFTKGFTVTVTDSQGGIFTVSTSKECIIARNTLTRMSALKVRTGNSVIPPEGGEVTLEFFSNVPCHAKIPAEAQNWISIAPETKDMTKLSIGLIVQPNTGLARSATVDVVEDNNASNIVLSYNITQEPNHEAQLEVEIEREALIAFYNALDGDNWNNNENWCSDKPVGEWYGVDVNDGYVSGLSLATNNLAGDIPNVFSAFKRLKSLRLCFNDKLKGNLPESIISSDWFQYYWGEILIGTAIDISLDCIPAPSFSITDTEGNLVESNDIYENNSLLILFQWHMWSNDTYDYLIPYYESYGDKGLFVLGVFPWDLHDNYMNKEDHFPWPSASLNGISNYIIPGQVSYPILANPIITVIDCSQRTVLYCSYYPNTGKYDVSNIIIDYFPVEQSITGLVPPDNEIWYVSTNGGVINPSVVSGFDGEIISNKVQRGIGVITYDRPISVIPAHCFENCLTLQEVSLPNTVTSIPKYAFAGCQYLKSVYIPQKCKIIDEFSFYDCRNLININLPNALERIEQLAFADCWYLSDIIFPSQLDYIGWGSFSGCNLSHIHIPESVTTLIPNAFSCKNIVSFSGKYATNDGFGIVVPDDSGMVIFGCFAGANTDCSYYEIPSTVTHLAMGAFAESQFVKKVIIPEGVPNIPWQAFQLSSVESVLLPESLEVIGEAAFRASRLKTITIPRGVNEIYQLCFYDCHNLTDVTIKGHINSLPGGCFSSCWNLSKIVLPESLLYLDLNRFLDCPSLKKMYIRALIPPVLSNVNCIWTDQDDFYIYVPAQSLELYKSSSSWSSIANHIIGFEYDDIEPIDYYLSTDYSADGRITTLQNATVGAGIDLILMGDAFSDRQIADGTYASVMQKAMNAFFSEEPYKTMKNCFNVYQVDVVSATEGYEHAGQALGTGRGDGTYCYGNDSKVIEYARAVVGDARMDNALVIVMMNEDAYAGTCYMYYPDSGDYGRGLSIAYFPTSSDTGTFNGLVSHEAGGHGFAKLADEYAYEYMGAIPADEMANRKALEPYGWWKNVDFTSDPTQVKWSHFIADARYDGQGLGCFEGGLTYWSGVWRPTENSIMRYNTGGFNAPSREAIWYRIHKLAYGENWQYNYEDFVAYDAVNRAAAASYQAPRPDYVTRQLPKPTPPVVVGHSWREALKLR